MTKEKKKVKRTIPLRVSGESIVKDNNRPSKLLFDLAIEAEKAEVNKPVLISADPPTTPYHPLLPPTTKKAFEVSPKRDYTKVANSINRDAVPSGLFKGTSKNTYDVLYQRTRGAITPTRSIKIVQSDLLVWANISHNTLRSHLKHLQSIGLVKIIYRLGDNKGAEYEVFLPEEINLEEDSYHLLPPPTTSTSLNLVGGTTQNLVGGGGTLTTVNIGESESSKTSLKTSTKNDDDMRVNETFAMLNSRLDAAVKKLTGKGVSRHEAEKWGMLAELLILEMEKAASRTDSISSVPAFLTEVLRRKLLGGNSSAAIKTSKNKPDTVGKPNEAGDYEIKPLDEKGREAALEQLREFAHDDFLPEFKKWYIAEDWEWIMKQLGIN